MGRQRYHAGRADGPLERYALPVPGEETPAVRRCKAVEHAEHRARGPRPFPSRVSPAPYAASGRGSLFRLPLGSLFMLPLPWIAASTRRGPAHCGQTSTSMPNVRRSRSAHGKRCRRLRLWPPRCGARRRARAPRSACWRHTAAIADDAGVAALSAPAASLTPPSLAPWRQPAAATAAVCRGTTFGRNPTPAPARRGRSPDACAAAAPARTGAPSRPRSSSPPPSCRRDSASSARSRSGHPAVRPAATRSPPGVLLPRGDSRDFLAVGVEHQDLGLARFGDSHHDAVVAIAIGDRYPRL